MTDRPLEMIWGYGRGRREATKRNNRFNPSPQMAKHPAEAAPAGSQYTGVAYSFKACPQVVNRSARCY
jgi:hypothetical protein